jgi:hypothetical protein
LRKNSLCNQNRFAVGVSGENQKKSPARFRIVSYCGFNHCIGCWRSIVEQEMSSMLILLAQTYFDVKTGDQNASDERVKKLGE